MRIGLAGDWHASFNPTRAAIDLLLRAGVEAVLHVGDFGFYGHAAGKQYLDLVSKRLGDVPIYVTPGNHEDYDYLQSVDHVTPWNEWCYVRDNIAFARRGFDWEWDGVKFLSLGGAPSVDRTYRLSLQAQTGRKYWWHEEFIQDIDVETVQRAVTSNGPFDVMITHDAPFYRELDEYLKPNPFGFPENDLMYAEMGRRQMHRAAHAVMPKILVHGHYHVPFDTNKNWASVDGGPGYLHSNDVIGQTRIVGLNKEMDPGSIAVLDTSDLALEIIH